MESITFDEQLIAYWYFKCYMSKNEICLEDREGVTWGITQPDLLQQARSLR